MDRQVQGIDINFELTPASKGTTRLNWQTVLSIPVEQITENFAKKGVLDALELVENLPDAGDEQARLLEAVVFLNLGINSLILYKKIHESLGYGNGEKDKNLQAIVDELSRGKADNSFPALLSHFKYDEIKNFKGESSDLEEISVGITTLKEERPKTLGRLIKDLNQCLAFLPISIGAVPSDERSLRHIDEKIQYCLFYLLHLDNIIVSKIKQLNRENRGNN